MKRIIILSISIFAIAFAAFANPAYTVNSSNSENQEISAPKIQVDTAAVKIYSQNGDLIINSTHEIKQVQVYSAIGGLLYSGEFNYTEARIANLPKTVLVVRVRLKNNTVMIYKVKNS